MAIWKRCNTPADLNRSGDDYAHVLQSWAVRRLPSCSELSRNVVEGTFFVPADLGALGP